MAARLGQCRDGDPCPWSGKQALVDCHPDATRGATRIAHAGESSLQGDAGVVQRVRDGQTERHQQPLLDAPRRRAQVDMAIDQAGHHSQVVGIKDVRTTRYFARRIDVNNGVAFEHERRPAYRVGARAIDQGATTDSSRHTPIMKVSFRDQRSQPCVLLHTLCSTPDAGGSNRGC